MIYGWGYIEEGIENIQYGIDCLLKSTRETIKDKFIKPKPKPGIETTYDPLIMKALANQFQEQMYTKMQESRARIRPFVQFDTPEEENK